MTASAAAQDPPLNELDVARAVAAGTLPSGHPCAGYRLWCLRISGTGLAARPALGEIALRDADTWLSPEMIERCRGLPIVVEHPASGKLNSDEFAARIVGMIIWPYVADNELWGIGKIYDADANTALEAGACSTSPSVSFAANDGGQVLDLGDGKRLNIEGTPARLDHLAIVPNAAGVWDRGIPGRGVRADQIQPGDKPLSESMTDNNAPPDPVMTALNKLTDCLTGMAAKMEATGARLDKMCNRLDAIEGERDADPNDVGARLTAADSAKPMPKTIEEQRAENQARAAAQLRADRACVAFGERAPPPMQGEEPLAYRKRLLRPYRKYSPDYADVDVDAVTDAAMFNVIEQRVYADAVAASERGDHLPQDQIIPVTTTDESGRKVITWRGRRTFIAHMKPASMRAKFTRPNHVNNTPA